MSSKDQDLTLQQRTDRLLGRVAGGRYTPLVPKANISEDKMTHEETETEKVQYDTEPNFDAEKVAALLEIVEGTRDYPGLEAIKDDALRALAACAAEVKQKLEDQKEEKES